MDSLNPIKLLHSISKTIDFSLKNDDDVIKGKMILEILLFYEDHKALNKYINRCIKYAFSNDNADDCLLFRADSTGIAIFVSFVGICLNSVFENHIKQYPITNTNIIQTIILVLALAPIELRKICMSIFNMVLIKRNNRKIAYRSICNLVIFRYIIPQIINYNLRSSSVISECKRIRSMCNFDLQTDTSYQSDVMQVQIMSSIQMLVSGGIGLQIKFKLEPLIYKDYLIKLGLDETIYMPQSSSLKATSLQDVTFKANRIYVPPLKLNLMEKVTSDVLDDSSSEKRNTK